MFPTRFNSSGIVILMFARLRTSWLDHDCFGFGLGAFGMQGFLQWFSSYTKSWSVDNHFSWIIWFCTLYLPVRPSEIVLKMGLKIQKCNSNWKEMGHSLHIVLSKWKFFSRLKFFEKKDYFLKLTWANLGNIFIIIILIRLWAWVSHTFSYDGVLD